MSPQLAHRDKSQSLEATGQVMNLGSPSEFAASIEEQRTRIATAAKDLGIRAGQ
jgi:hypothetical protein